MTERDTVASYLVAVLRLDELAVRNLGLIAEAQVDLEPGLIAITGETGAGKTMLLGALRLIRGDTVRTDIIGSAADDAEAQARLVGADEEVVVRRRLTEGRSRAYVDGSLATVGELAERVGPMIELVAQHEHLSLVKSATVRAMLDEYLDAEGTEAKGAYRIAWERLVEVEAAAAQLGDDPGALERSLDLVRHQAREIASAGLESGEDERLASEVGVLRHRDQLVQAVADTRLKLNDDDGAIERVGEAIDQLRRVVAYDDRLTSLLASLEATGEELGDVSSRLRTYLEDQDMDPGRLHDVEERIAEVAALKRKYGPSLADVIEFGANAEAEVHHLEVMVDRAAGMERELATARLATEQAGERLATARRRAGKAVVARAVEVLGSLGFTDPRLEAEVTTAAPGPEGADKCRFLFSSSASLQPAPIDRVASGGELSRLVLALRLAGSAGSAPVVAFDEIDAGVGGEVATALGRLLGQLGTQRQVLCVTHLPQVAAFATQHLVVERSGDIASIRVVQEDERVAELARMLGGGTASLTGEAHAAALLAAAREGSAPGATVRDGS